MFTLKQQLQARRARAKTSGFTIVELLIVIVVIGILAALVIVTFSGIQQKGRDSERRTDLKAIKSHLEVYYTETGTYPTVAMMNDTGFRGKYMKGLSLEALEDPKSTTTGLNAGAATDTQYGYVPLAAGAACPAATGTSPDFVSTCDSFTLTANSEANTDVYTESSN